MAIHYLIFILDCHEVAQSATSRNDEIKADSAFRTKLDSAILY
ncbi:hypothetical protein ACWIUD_11660 [Helicobacter sp. 23-1044]